MDVESGCTAIGGVVRDEWGSWKLEVGFWEKHWSGINPASENGSHSWKASVGLGVGLSTGGFVMWQSRSSEDGLERDPCGTTFAAAGESDTGLAK